MNREWTIAGALGLLVLGAAPSASAQDTVWSRDARLKSAFSDVADRHRFSVGRVMIDGKPSAYGILISDSRLLTLAAPIDDASGGPAGADAAADAPMPELRVRFQGQEAYTAKLVARDERWNLALLSVQPAELVDPVPLQQSGAPRLGRWVVGVGTAAVPLTVGAVSAVNRAVVETESLAGAAGANPAAAMVRGGRRYRDVFQHDSMLPPDSDQGIPLFDSAGHFVGLSVETRTRGTSYAVPAERIREALPALLAGRTTPGTRPGFIGINPGVMDPAEAQRLGIPGGVPVTRLVQIHGEYRGAAKAGIQVGDIILSVDGQEVYELQTLIEVVQFFNPGEQVEFLVLRDAKRLSFTVTIEERPRSDR